MSMIDPTYEGVSIRRQAELFDIPRANLYYEAVPVSEEEHKLMRRIDKIYTDHPYFGYRRITNTLRTEDNLLINYKKVRRLMAKMGLIAIYPKPKLSLGNTEHLVYPYLLKDLDINHA